jgi:hypothetical protein
VGGSMGREESKDQAKTAQKEKEQANHAKKVVLPEPRKLLSCQGFGSRG